MLKRYSLASNSIGLDEISVAKDVLDRGELTMGAVVRELESSFESWLGVKNAIMVNSGSSANLLMVDRLIYRTKIESPLKPGDEILVPALAWPTTI